MNDVSFFLRYFGIAGWIPEVESAPKPLGLRVLNYPAGYEVVARLCSGSDGDYYFRTHSALIASRSLASGVKVFNPTPDECEMLAMCDSEVNAADYRQPYPTMFYTVPPALQAGEDEHGPGRWTVVAVDCLRPGRVLITGIIMRPPSGEQFSGFHLFPDVERTVADNIGDSLDPKSAGVIRLALNCGLFLAVRGTTERQANPARLRALKRRKRNQPSDWRAIQRQIKAEPVLLEPIRRVLVRPARLYAERPGGPTGTGKRPHERRGHFRMQACGPRWTERRLIFVEPFTVGGPVNVRGTYTEYQSATPTLKV
jgi:hypothetical protein